MKNSTMTQEEKNLLLKDLCARLPYGVKCTFNGKNIYKVYGIDEVVNDDGDWEYAICTKRTSPLYISDCKPYLFPLSSMTEEQEKELYDELIELELKALNDEISHIEVAKFEIDYYLKNHFDYRGLIPMGLAIDATNLNIY